MDLLAHYLCHSVFYEIINILDFFSVTFDIPGGANNQLPPTPHISILTSPPSLSAALFYWKETRMATLIYSLQIPKDGNSAKERFGRMLICAEKKVPIESLKKDSCQWIHIKLKWGHTHEEEMVQNIIVTKGCICKSSLQDIKLLRTKDKVKILFGRYVTLTLVCIFKALLYKRKSQWKALERRMVLSLPWSFSASIPSL